MRRHMITAVLGLAVLGLIGCGDDDEADDEFCDVARELAAEDETAADDPIFDRYLDLAPEEIRDDAALAIEAIGERGDEAFNDPEVLAAVANIEAFEAEECDIERPDGDDEGDDGTTTDEDGTTTDDTDAEDDTDETDGDTTTTLEESTTTTVADTSATTTP